MDTEKVTLYIIVLVLATIIIQSIIPGIIKSFYSGYTTIKAYPSHVMSPPRYLPPYRMWPSGNYAGMERGSWLSAPPYSKLMARDEPKMLSGMTPPTREKLYNTEKRFGEYPSAIDHTFGVFSDTVGRKKQDLVEYVNEWGDTSFRWEDPKGEFDAWAF